MGLLDFLLDAGNYESRKVGRDVVDGLTVSTCYTTDEGYETAILDTTGAYPVERYSSEEEAAGGHKKWCEKAKTITKITMLGGLHGLVGDKEITLVRDIDSSKN
jgi:hypothetical protein